MPQETLHYIFKTMDAITCEPAQIKGEWKKWNLDTEEINDALDATFAERGISFISRYEDYNRLPFFGFLQTKVTFAEKIALIEMRLIDEAILLRGHASGGGIIWNEKMLIDIANTPNPKDTILSYIKTLAGQLIDAYLDARRNEIANNVNGK